MNETETELVKLNHGVVDLIAKWEVSREEGKELGNKSP